MAVSILLVDDQAENIEAIKVAVEACGYGFNLASSVAEAVLSFSQLLPSVVILNPHVEQDRGQLVLEELKTHPDHNLLKVLLLGESIPGFGYGMTPLPVDSDLFLRQLADMLPADGLPVTEDLEQQLFSEESLKPELDSDLIIDGKTVDDANADLHADLLDRAQWLVARAQNVSSARKEDVNQQVLQAEAHVRQIEQQVQQVEAREQNLLLSLEQREAVLQAEREVRLQAESDLAAFQQTQNIELERLEKELQAAREQHRAVVEQLSEQAASTDHAGEQLNGQIAAMTSRIAEVELALRDSQEEVQQLQSAHRELEEEKRVRQQTEQALEVATAQLRQIESESQLPLPGAPGVRLPRLGNASLSELAQLVVQLVVGKLDARIDLATSDGRRVLWVRRGVVVAAESSFAHESLIDRARRDGLIDVRQEAELRLLKGVPQVELLALMKGRGWIKGSEGIQLAQRFVEQIATESFSENTTRYRVTDEAVGAEVLLAEPTRSTLRILAGSLRRTLSADTVVQELGGTDAIPHLKPFPLPVEALGFSDKEMKMLSLIDGTLSIENLAMRSGLPAFEAYRVLRVGHLFGLLEMKKVDAASAPVSPMLDVQRLDAKFSQVLDADYFSILGLHKQAGNDEVIRAFERLGSEFHPLKFSAYPDAQVQQRAQIVYGALEEAMKALSDDRRRSEYAKHLLES